MNNDLSTTRRTNLKKSEAIIERGLNDIYAIGIELDRIKAEKLYLDDHDTFEEYCMMRWQKSRRWAYQLIGASGISTKLPKNVRNCAQNEYHLRALSKVPEEDREAVLLEAGKSGEVTAESIKNAAKALARSKKGHSDIELDKTGWPIPEGILSEWKRAEKVKDLLSLISEVRSVVKRGIDGEDLIFGEVTTSLSADLNNAYTSLKCVIPFAVCPSCSGQIGGGCSLCNGRGFLSEFRWKHVVPEEIKAIRGKR